MNSLHQDWKFFSESPHGEYVRLCDLCLIVTESYLTYFVKEYVQSLDNNFTLAHCTNKNDRLDFACCCKLSNLTTFTWVGSLTPLWHQLPGPHSSLLLLWPHWLLCAFQITLFVPQGFCTCIPLFPEYTSNVFTINFYIRLISLSKIFH